MWRKFWLLFTVIWVVVAGLQVFTLLAFSDEPEKVWQPLDRKSTRLNSSHQRISRMPSSA